LALEATDPAQEATDLGQDDMYFETVEVTVVNVDVHVTDKKGNPIKDLKKEDFEIFENGRAVAISNFSVVENGRPQTAPESSKPKDRVAQEPAPPVDPRFGRTPVPEDQRLHLVIYVDNFNIRPFNRNRVFRRLREFLQSKLSRDDRVMLVSYDRSLHLRHEFTSDAQIIAGALFELEGLSGFGVQADSDRRDIVRAIEEATTGIDVTWRVRQYAESAFNDLSFSLDALNEIVSWLAGLPGRKAVLYVSDGLPMVPGEDLFYMVNERFKNESSVLSMAREFDASRRFMELTARANSNRVTFYTLDAAGLRPPQTSSVDSPTVGTAGVQSFTESVYISNIQAPLLMMAEETGGQTIYNTNDVGPGLERIASDFRSYYSLGYTPTHSGSGRYYKIEVKVNRKGLRVRHREGYRDKPLYTRMEEGTISALRFGFDSNPMDLRVRLGQGSSAEKDQWEVPIVVGIRLDKIVLISRETFHEARLKLYFGAMDEKGRVSAVQEYPLPLKISNDELEGVLDKLYVFQNKMRMRSGPHRVAVGLWDELAAEGSFVNQTVMVGGG
ncbi:MAG: VWA domain-containing protein, partial [Thermoanaerobaculia bacterium]